MHREKGGRVGNEDSNMNVPSIFKSRKFWLAMLDVVISSALFFGAKYMDPSAAENINFIIGVIQAPFIMVIGGIAYEDAALKSSGSYPIDDLG